MNLWGHSFSQSPNQKLQGCLLFFGRLESVRTTKIGWRWLQSLHLLFHFEIWLLKINFNSQCPPPQTLPPFADQEPEAQFLLLIFTNKPLVYLLHTKYIRCRRRPPQSAAAAANTYIDIQNWCNLYYYYYYRASRDHEIHIQSNLAIRNWNRKNDLFVLCLLQWIWRIFENQKAKEEYRGASIAS